MKTIKHITLLTILTSLTSHAWADSAAFTAPVVIPPTVNGPAVNDQTVTGVPKATVPPVTPVPAVTPAPDAASMLTPAAAAADANAIANENMVLNQQNSDPAIAFFTALSTCAPGVYQENNPLAAQYGNMWLNQQVTGYDDKNVCQVILTTPDGRTLNCGFDDKDIAQLVDQHFLSGMLQSGTKDVNKDYLDSERIWSDLKSKKCGFAK